MDKKILLYQFSTIRVSFILMFVILLSINSVSANSFTNLDNTIAELDSGDTVNITLKLYEVYKIKLENQSYNITLNSILFEEPFDKVMFTFGDFYNFMLTKGPTVSLSIPINLSTAYFVSFKLLNITSPKLIELTVFFEEREIPPEDIIQCNAINNETANSKENSSPENIEPQIEDAKEGQALESKILKQILELKSVENLSNLSNQSNKTDEKNLTSIQEVKETDKDDEIFINTSKDKDSSFLPNISDTNSWLLAVILTIIFFFLTLRIILKKR